MSTPGGSRKILLLGMMGAGKTTVGAALSQRLGWPYVDNDRLLERSTGPATEIVAEEGEKALRDAETHVLTLLLGMPGPLVAGIPGGVVLSPVNRQRIAAADAHVVWLKASAAVLARRVGSGAGRPWLGGDPATALKRLADERDPFYAELADQVVDVDVTAAGAAAKQIVEQL